MRKIDGWQTLAEKPSDHIIDLADDRLASCGPKTRQQIPTPLATGPMPGLNTDCAPIGRVRHSDAGWTGLLRRSNVAKSPDWRMNAPKTAVIRRMSVKISDDGH
jgi:hypothetical protein